MAGSPPRSRPLLPRRDVRDPRALRALAHPLRQRMLDILHRVGPATATTMARQVGESTGATSYHLRQLARYGYITLDRAQGNRRERWWRAVHADFRLGHGLRGGAGRAAADELLRNQLTSDSKVLAEYLRERRETKELDDRAFFSHSIAHLTPQELRAFGEDIVKVIKRYYRPDAQRPSDAQPIKLMLYAFPWPSSERRG